MSNLSELRNLHGFISNMKEIVEKRGKAMIINIRHQSAISFCKVALACHKEAEKHHSEFFKYVWINPNQIGQEIVITNGKYMVTESLDSIFMKDDYDDLASLEGPWKVVKVSAKEYQFQRQQIDVVCPNLYRVIPENPHYYPREEFAGHSLTMSIVSLLTRNHGQILDWDLCKMLSDYIEGSTDIGTDDPSNERRKAVVFKGVSSMLVIMPLQVD